MVRGGRVQIPAYAGMTGRAAGYDVMGAGYDAMPAGHDVMGTGQEIPAYAGMTGVVGMTGGGRNARVVCAPNPQHARVIPRNAPTSFPQSTASSRPHHAVSHTHHVIPA